MLARINDHVTRVNLCVLGGDRGGCSRPPVFPHRTGGVLRPERAIAGAGWVPVPDNATRTISEADRYQYEHFAATYVGRTLKGEKPAMCHESEGRTERSGQSEKKRKVLAGYHGRNNDRGRYAAEPRIPSDGVFGFREAFLPRQC